ncbi:MAG: septal ring lytic transglycosylase RlpA family lipoprotein [Bacteroidetes bacterium]|nr:MAG: septal ring lytic transglycosylase RlpA family lipoprotein [Bacteroidota bacterium]
MLNNLKLVISAIFVIIISACEGTKHEKLSVIPVGDGKASWYGTKFHGNITASGEKYNMNDFTAAHRVLKFGTILRVTNINKGISVVVRINDRGPYNYNRVIDLSKSAAVEIDMVKSGLADVKIEIIGYKPVNFENLIKHYQNLLILNAKK